MSQRIVQAGTVLAVSADGCRISVNSPCQRCRTGCLSFTSTSPGTSIDVPGRCVSGKSGRMGSRVVVGISGRGLTALAAILFGPVILLMVALMGVTTLGYSGAGFAAGALAAICVTLLISGNWARRVADTGLALRVTSVTGAE